MHSLCPSCFHRSGCLNKACRRIQVSFAEFTSHLIPFSLEHHALSYNTGAKSLSAPCTFISCSGVLKHRIVNTNQFLYIHTQTHTDYIYSTFYSLSFKPTAISMTGNMPVHDNMSYHSPRLRFALTLKAEVQLISAFFFFFFSSKTSPHCSSSTTVLLGVLLWACCQGSEANGILWPFWLNSSISAMSIFIHLGW